MSPQIQQLLAEFTGRDRAAIGLEYPDDLLSAGGQVAAQTGWAGSIEDVFDHLREHSTLCDKTLMAFVQARAVGSDVVRAMFVAHNGTDLPFAPGSSAHSAAVRWASECEICVSWLRGRGVNALGCG